MDYEEANAQYKQLTPENQAKINDFIADLLRKQCQSDSATEGACQS